MFILVDIVAVLVQLFCEMFSFFTRVLFYSNYPYSRKFLFQPGDTNTAK